ncbi:MAG TPA: acyl-CoA thioesterase, partial [Firmicutes bacterium]|nr:acyl-CoA thioesterase [Bacillota bacterium]
LGMPYTSLEKNKIYLPAIKVFCQYKLPVFYDDLIKVVTRVVDLQDVKISFKHDIFREKENPREKPALVALGETEYAFVSEEGKPLVLKKHHPFFWRRLQEAVDREEEE